ncbi:MAG: glycosyltransferase [Nitrosomonadales bacterium]|nr:glycosyltransferase [Nitrosomonadales bacterium]
MARTHLATGWSNYLKRFTKLIIHATNIHQGGGRSLLDALLKVLTDEVILSVDERMPLPAGMANNVQVKRIKPFVIQRILAEKWLAIATEKEDVVLCFGNLPPLFRLRGHVVVFVQNRYLVDDVDLGDFPPKTRLRLWVERLWLSSRMANADEFVVQTPSMKRLLEARTKGSISVRVLPFMQAHEGYARKAQQSETNKGKDFDFIYVASGEPHKNHRQLIEAWCLLAKAGLFPSLKLTLDKVQFAVLCGWLVQKIEQHGLNVENLGSLPHELVAQLYGRAGALIYPSTFESFGLPLIEARQAGLPILASELDYVRDVIDPEQTFDPESAISVARAVKRHLGMEVQPLPLHDAVGFLKHILGRTE